MLLIDNSIRLEYGFKLTGSFLGLNIYTNTRRLVLKCESLWELYDLIGSIQQSVQKCAYTQINRFISFAPQRAQAYCKWYLINF